MDGHNPYFLPVGRRENLLKPDQSRIVNTGSLGLATIWGRLPLTHSKRNGRIKILTTIIKG